jgi:hypothetical protein
MTTATQNETETMTDEEIEAEDSIRVGLYNAIEQQIKDNPDIPKDVLVKIAKLLAPYAV